ncbi:MAG TPA: response regulator [bacterium]|nr:response regulator [bacterium]
MRKPSDCRLLIAEDEVGIQKIYEKTFAQEGYQIVLAATGGEILAELEETRFDLLITDLKLDHTSALEVLPTISKRYPQLPIVVVSGHYDKLGDTFSRKGYNIRLFFNKPLSTSVLKSAVRNLLGIPEDVAAPEV